MTAPRPWWKKKRWLLGIPLWLALTYTVSAGPAVYAQRHGWLPTPIAHFVYGPLNEVLKNVPGLRPALSWYIRWWHELP